MKPFHIKVIIAKSLQYIIKIRVANSYILTYNWKHLFIVACSTFHHCRLKFKSLTPLSFQTTEILHPYLVTKLTIGIIFVSILAWVKNKSHSPMYTIAHAMAARLDLAIHSSLVCVTQCAKWVAFRALNFFINNVVHHKKERATEQKEEVLKVIRIRNAPR